jgi:flagellar biosynthesis protein FlhF
MRVKKFEAKSMKEALLMVKHELGPDAIILSAKDHRKSYGLVGEGSVEVTAAVSEAASNKKKFTESRLTAGDKERFDGSTAREQKQLIEKMADRRLERQAQIRAQLLEQARNSSSGPAPKAASIAPLQSAPAATRERTRVSYIDIQDDNQAPAASSTSGTVSGQTQNIQLADLRSEILRLHEVIQSFHKVPQTFAPSHSGAELGVPKELSFMYQKLHDAGLSNEVVTDLLRGAQNEIDPQHLNRRAAIDAWVARKILDNTKLSQDPFKGRVHTFVGPSGSGKSSVLIKMASHLVVTERKRIAVISSDTLKVGAVDQMKIYCRILNVPFAIVRGPKDWDWVLGQLSNVDHILVDSPGLPLKDLEEIHFLKSILPPEAVSSQTHLVLRATQKDKDAFEAARRYKSASHQDVIFTGLDQSVQHGLIYNFQLQTGTPLHSFGIGSRIPEDFEAATKERVLDLIFKLTKLRSSEERFGLKED